MSQCQINLLQGISWDSRLYFWQCSKLIWHWPTTRVTNSQLKIPWKTTLNSLTAYWKLIFIPWQLYFSIDYSLTWPYFSLFSLDKMCNSLIVKAKPWQLVSRLTTLTIADQWSLLCWKAKYPWNFGKNSGNLPKFTL